ncbi:GFA family protein [Pseudooceanicola batsensis]|uniref:GFA family protein n=1 Tax=Pseudooceanicola batsensis TaxID=314255 RepID=UPI000325A57B|nr:GFA family protein [Pseudooceanicola batsensis]
MSVTGRCYCGECAYEVTGKTFYNAQCHCRECQYISGGGPNFFMMCKAEDYRITRGAPRAFTRPDLDRAVTRHFCPTCGTHLNTKPRPGLMVIKVGTLDDMSNYPGPETAIYMCDTQPFHVLAEGVTQHDRLAPKA